MSRGLPFAVLLVLTLPFLIAWPADSSVSTTDSASQEITAEEAVLGLFFLSGPFVDRIPLLQETRAEILTSGHNIDEMAARDFVSELNSSDPAAFQRFGEALKSGNRVTIRSGLHEMANLLLDKLEAQFGDTEPVVSDGDLGSIWLVWGTFVFTVSIAYAVLYTSLAFGDEVYYWGLATNQEGTQLLADRLVNQLATASYR